MTLLFALLIGAAVLLVAEHRRARARRLEREREIEQAYRDNVGGR